MLEDMEALFSFENFPGNPPDSGSNCFCFPDMKSKIVGFHVLPEEKRIASTKTKEKCLLSDNKKTSELLFEPSTLHRYSTGMREMKLEYFFGENEDEPLVSAGILPFLGPNGSREMTYLGGIHANNSNNSSNNNNSSHGSHNSNSNNNITNSSSHSHNSHTTTSLNQSSGSIHNQSHNHIYVQQVDTSSSHQSSINNQNSHLNANSNSLNHQPHPTVNSRNSTGISTNTNNHTSNNTNTNMNVTNSLSSGIGMTSSNLYGSLSSPPFSSPSITSQPPS